MNVLAIESSGPEGSVAILREGEVLVEIAFACPRGRGSDLFRVLAEVVRPDVPLDRVLVGTGPGSYNGLRSGIAAAWGIASARGIPVSGVCSLLGYGESSYCILGDARAGQWFFARVEHGSLAEEPLLFSPEEAIRRVPCGLPVFCSAALPGLTGVLVRASRASILASVAASGSGPAEPFYLKPPHVTSPSKPAGYFPDSR